MPEKLVISSSNTQPGETIATYLTPDSPVSSEHVLSLNNREVSTATHIGELTIAHSNDIKTETPKVAETLEIDTATGKAPERPLIPYESYADDNPNWGVDQVYDIPLFKGEFSWERDGWRLTKIYEKSLNGVIKTENHFDKADGASRGVKSKISRLLSSVRGFWRKSR